MAVKTEHRNFTNKWNFYQKTNQNEITGNSVIAKQTW